MLSDLHVNVFYDPKKVNELISAPVSQWNEILASPESQTRIQDVDMLRKECGSGGDPSPSLFSSMLRAIRSNAAEAHFITISGDFLPHKIDCMFAKTVPGASAQQYASFTAKIIEYEVSQVRQALPKATLYPALGNNDSNCRDNHLDTETEWLRTLAKVAKDGVGPAWDKAATESFEQGGYYSAEMGAPMKRTRMIVVNDLFMVGGFKNCADKADIVTREKQIAWLRLQLNDAHMHHERVWIMGHIPPGFSPSGLLRHDSKAGEMCKSNDTPASLTAMDEFTDTMIANANITKLAIFGHMHQDHMELLEGSGGAVPAKIVGALIRPSFTIAQVDPMTSELADYTVMTSPDKEGSNWSKEYTFSEAYGYKGFTPQSLRTMIAQFRSDPSGTTKLSQEYLLHWSAGAKDSESRTQQIWPAFVCGMDHMHAVEYKQCVCHLGAASH